MRDHLFLNKSEHQFKAFMNDFFKSMSKADKQLYPKLKESILSSTWKIGFSSEIYNRLDYANPEFSDLLKDKGLDSFCMEVFLCKALDQGKLHCALGSHDEEEFHADDYYGLYESVSHVIKTKKLDKEINKLTDDSVMRQVFSEAQLRNVSLYETVK